MTKPFKKLLGNRVYLNMPTIAESNIILSEEVKKSIIASEQDKFQKLKVYAKGDLVTIVEEGDEVLVHPGILANALVVPLNKEISVILVNSLDIIQVW